MGVLNYFQQHVGRIDQFDIYCGTSTGSLIVPLAALGEINLLKTIYTTSRQSDILNMGSIGNLVTQVSLHDVTPLKELIERTLTQARYPAATDAKQRNLPGHSLPANRATGVFYDAAPAWHPGL